MALSKDSALASLPGVIAAFSPGLTNLVKSISATKTQASLYSQLYGPVGIVLPFFASSDAWQLVKKTLETDDDKILLNFVSAQMAQANMVAVTGAIMAQIAITALALDYLSTAHWVARAFFLSSLLAGCASVYYAMSQLRTFGRLISAKDVREWLQIEENRKTVPSPLAVIALDTPRGLVDMAAVSFTLGLSIYVVFVFVNNLDVNAGKNDSRNIVIAYFVSMYYVAFLYRGPKSFVNYEGPASLWAGLAPQSEAMSQKAADQGVDSEQGDGNSQSLPQWRTPEDNSIHMGSLPSSTPKAEALDAERLALVAALQETITARRKCLEADERLLNILEKQQARFG